MYYQSNRSEEGDGGMSGRRVLDLEFGPIHVTWTGIFLLNILFPGFLGFVMTEGMGPPWGSGRYGIVGAMWFLFILGNWVSIAVPKIGRPLMVGGFFVGLLQIFPILQLFAGMAAIEIGCLVDVAKRNSEGTPHLIGEPGGLIVTLATGTLLMMVSLSLGLVVRMMTHRRWWGKPDAAQA
jgi:hypothetical protein